MSYFTARVYFGYVWVRMCGCECVSLPAKENASKKLFVQTKDVVNSYIVTIITVLFSDGRIFAQSKNFFDRINFAYSSKVNRDDRA